MEAMQYIYTSWKNGDSQEKGYMVYSKSEGITDTECTIIKDAMRYIAPKEMMVNPTESEIEELFPYAFAFFTFPDGRECVALSTYLGRDYSGRYGNYIIYALVFEKGELSCRPAELFGEPYLKKAMTPDELNASSPVPPLAMLHIEKTGDVINDDQLSDFLLEKSEEAPVVIEMVLQARNRKIPFYINDTRENLVQWAALVQRVLPKALAQKFSFITYVCNHEELRSKKAADEGLDFSMIGVRPDANYFNYATECQSSRQIVIDFQGGNMTGEIEPGSFASAMGIDMNFEQADLFSSFLEKTSFVSLSGELDNAWEYFSLFVNDCVDSMEYTDDILAFGRKYCGTEENSTVASKLLAVIQEKGWIISEDTCISLWDFVIQYIPFMKFSLFAVERDALAKFSTDEARCENTETMLKKLKASSEEVYKEFLEYLDTAEGAAGFAEVLSSSPKIYTSGFYALFFLQNYAFPSGVKDERHVSRLLGMAFSGMADASDGARQIAEVLLSCTESQKLFSDAADVLLERYLDNAQGEEVFIKAYSEAVTRVSSSVAYKCESMMLNLSRSSALAVKLFERKLAGSQEPENDFWTFYHTSEKLLLSVPGISLGNAVGICINAADTGVRLKCAVRFVRELDPSFFDDHKTADTVFAAFDASSAEKLSEIDSGLLRQVCQLCLKEDHSLLKITAVLAGQQIKQKSMSGEKGSLKDIVSGMQLSLAGFNKRDYDCYVDFYLAFYEVFLTSAEDTGKFMEIFYHPDFFSRFVLAYLSDVRKLKKKQLSDWESRIAWMAVYSVRNEECSKTAAELNRMLIHALHAYNDDDFFGIKNKMLDSVSSDQCGIFFERVSKKESISDRMGSTFGGFFRRK